MKKKLACVLALVLVLAATAALAQGSPNLNVFRSENGFSMNCVGYTGMEAGVMSLKAGDMFYVSNVITSGEIKTSVRENAGDVLFEASEAVKPGTTITIPKDGIYRFSVEATDATGSVVYQRTTQTETSGNTMPIQRARVSSVLGYSIEYDTDYFTYLQDADTFLTANTDDHPEASLMLGKDARPAALIVDELAALEGAEVLTPVVIDWRVANLVRVQNGTGDSGTVTYVAVIETSETTSFVATGTYFASDEAGAGEKIQNMILSLSFLNM